jgi:spermidine synthase
MIKDNWFYETLHDGIRQCFLVEKTLYEEKTAHQHLLILQNNVFGKILVLDGIVQLTEKDEFIYHEMLAHVPLMLHDKPSKVLIVGGGDGGIAREVIKHREVDQIDMVEIDKSVIEFSQQHLEFVHQGVFSHPKLNIIIEDAAKFVQKVAPNSYDIIIVDSTDPIGVGEVLFSHQFYSNCADILTDMGVLVTQNGVPLLQHSHLQSSMAYFKELFVDSGCFLAHIPTYYGGAMSLGYASHGDNRQKLDDAKIQARLANIITEHGDLRYYNIEMQRSAFTLPQYIRGLI